MSVATDTLPRLAAGAVLAIAVGYVLHIAASILIPLVLGAFIAYIFITLTDWLRAAPVVWRFLPGWLAHVAALAVIVGLIWGLVLLVTSNLARVEEQLPVYRDNLQALTGRMAAWLNLEDVPTLQEVFDRAVAAIDLSRVLGGTVTVVAALIGNLLVVFIYTAFLLMERSALMTKLELLADTPAGAKRIAAALGEISERIGRYLTLKAFVSTIVGLASWAVMRVVGIDYAEFWAVLIFVFNFIPYVGSFVAVLLPVAISLVQFGTLGPFLVALLGLTAAQVAVGNFLEPNLMGRSLNLSPVVILLSLAAWSALWGTVGAFLCVPITVIMMIIFAEFEVTRPLAILISQDGRIDRDDNRRGDHGVTETAAATASREPADR